MKLSEYAEKNSVTYRTAWNWFKAGKIPHARKSDSGGIVVDENEGTREELIKLQRGRIEALEKELAETKKKEL